MVLHGLGRADRNLLLRDRDCLRRIAEFGDDIIDHDVVVDRRVELVIRFHD
jgi:hypothetical protein